MSKKKLNDCHYNVETTSANSNKNLTRLKVRFK